MSFITSGAIDAAALLAGVSDPELGGTALFMGSVRRGPDDGEVTEIEYLAYQEMLESEFGKIVAEAAARWIGTRINGVHRIGRIPVGEPSIAVVAAAPHRADAFAACRHAIEEAKKRLPVWKKEFFEDGTSEWRENRIPAADRD